MSRSKVRVKIMANTDTAPMLRGFVDRLQAQPFVPTDADVQIAAWLLEVARACDDGLRAVPHVPR